MRITAADVIPYALPFREPYVTARGGLERRAMVLVRLRTDQGIEGLGEAVPLSLRGGPSLAEIEAELREVTSRELVGSDLGSDPSPPVGEARPIGSGLSFQAAAALEIARLDLAAKLIGQPLWQLLGCRRAEPVSCNATLASADPAFVAEQAQRWAAWGFETFKLKVGVPGDVAQVKALREAVGPQARLRVDANGAWGPQEAVARLTAMEHYGIELVEQPAADLEDLAVVRGQTAIPIAADESVASTDDAQRAIELGACQLATVKLAKTGGIGTALGIAALLPAYLSSALDGPVGIAAAAHAAQVLPGEGPAAGLSHGLATQLLFAATIAAVECEVRDGYLHLPDGPGLGVEIDERALERHRV